MMKRSIIAICLALVLCVSFCGCKKGGEDAPAGMTRVSNEYVDYDFYAPSDWIVGNNDGCISVKKSDSVLANVSMTAYRTEDGITDPQSYWQSYLDSFKSAYTDFELLSDSACLLGQREAHEYVYTGSFAGTAAKYLQAVCVKDGVVYLFTYTADPEQYEKYLPEARKMLDNFSFKD